MESYPGELLVGVFPLVFCVDATLEKKVEKSRSQFDMFLDTIAHSSSLVDSDSVHEGGPMMQRVEQEQSDGEDDLLLKIGKGNNPEFYAEGFERRRSSSTKSGDDLSSTTSIATSSMQDQQNDKRDKSKIGARSPFPKIKRSGRTKRRGSGDTGTTTETDTVSSNPTASERSIGVGIDIPKSFAEDLQQGQSFFQRSRIVSCSARHGFPPSKDATGKSNRVIALTGLKAGQQPLRYPTPHQYRQMQKKAKARLKSAKPIDGILPKGWLEKHAAALPSVIIVVTQIHVPNQDIQQRQDELLSQALENLEYSLAPKRRVDIKVVALIQEGVSPISADQWSQEQWSRGTLGRLPSILQRDNYQKVSSSSDPASIITLLEIRELRVDRDTALPAAISKPSTSPLPALYRGVRRSSLRYYKDRSREVKEKLLRLRTASSRSPVLLPLLIRYCFKAAIFYEFRWKQEKSLKYMVEAYRLVETYYNYLLFWKDLRETGAFADYSDESDSSQGELEAPILSTPSSDEVFDAAEGVEMSLPGSMSSDTSPISLNDLLTETPPIVPADMIHQCRKVADWLNFKILQMCLTSQNRSGIIAASTQWQRHSKTFCCPRRSFLNTASAPWLDWSYVAQQRVVVSQLLERYPPRSIGELGSQTNTGDSFDEDLIRCCPWRTYEAAAEAILKVGHRIRAVVEKGGLSSLRPPAHSLQPSIDRVRYVGDIGHDGFRPSFEEESQKSHIERALNCVLRGISLYEKEQEKLEKAQTLIQWSRSGTRLYYLAGGALLGLNRHSEAVPYLEKAVKLCKDWIYMQSLVRRLLVECHEQRDGGDIVGPIPDDDGSRRTRTSFLLDSYFNARLTSDELAIALEKAIGIIGVDVGGDGGDDRFLQWHCDFIDDKIAGSSTAPFSFSLTFPTCTHGMPGGKVEASIWIKSNMQYTVSINRISMITVLGPLFVPSKDFPSDVNPTDDPSGTITIQPNETVEFKTELILPAYAQNPADGGSDQSGEPKRSTGNGSGPKNTTSRLRSGGFTAAGGSQYSYLDENEDKAPSVVPWSTRCLGGKPLRCEGIILTFSLVSSTRSSTLIKLVIEAKQPEAQPNTKRTIFDENNYLSSAWKRLPTLPMDKGPRCLRLLSPIANMTVWNVTESLTNGKALEGTVNRVVLKLKAARNEICHDVVIRVTTSSRLTAPDGKEKQISLPDGESSSEDVQDMMNPRVRAPVLVKPDPSSNSFMTDFGYLLPSGWVLAGEGQSVDDHYTIAAPTIKAGESTYVCFDVYRPTPEPLGVHIKGNQEVVQETKSLNDCKCETNINVSIRYHQETAHDNDTAKSDETGANDFVSLDHCVNLHWISPMSVAFHSKAKKAYPSGNQHPSNIVPDHPIQEKESPDGSENETIVIHDGNVFTKGILNPIASTDWLDIEIDRVQFIETESKNTNCKFRLVSGLDDGGTIYQGKPSNPCRILRTGSKLSFAWMSKCSMDLEYREDSLTTPIGTISVHWNPSPIGLVEDLPFINKDNFSGRHGPLQLERSSVCRFSGPFCRIESAPFEVLPGSLPESIKVAVPFEVTYSIRNKTPVDQELEMILNDSLAPNDESSKDEFLTGGLAHEKTSLQPFESYSFSYTTIPMKVGKVDLPPISVFSRRFRTWIIRESIDRRSIYVVP